MAELKDPSLVGMAASNPFTAELGLLTKLVAPRVSRAKEDSSLPAPKPVKEAGRKRRSVPPLNELTLDPAAAFDGPSDARGGIHGGGRHASRDGVKWEQFTIEGYVRSSLRAAVQWVAVVAQAKTEPPRVVGYARPQFEGAGRDVRWKVRLSEPLVDGSKARAVGYLVDRRAFVAMGPLFRLSDGRLVADTDR